MIGKADYGGSYSVPINVMTLFSSDPNRIEPTIIFLGPLKMAIPWNTLQTTVTYFIELAHNSNIRVDPICIIAIVTKAICDSYGQEDFHSITDTSPRNMILGQLRQLEQKNHVVIIEYFLTDDHLLENEQDGDTLEAKWQQLPNRADVIRELLYQYGTEKPEFTYTNFMAPDHYDTIATRLANYLRQIQ